MADPRGFLNHPRETPTRRPVPVRLRDWKEVYEPFATEKLVQQASRCMDCGIPFCNNGCPLGNIIPDWNDLVYRGHWRDAIERLHATNNFPEFTGRLCPAPCEAACVLGINEDPVAIKQVEVEIIERAFNEGWVTPILARETTGKRVAVVGSGPAGLACAQQLARAGHDVHVFEKNGKAGGLLRYGIPDFKMEKHFIDRRVGQMTVEGVTFHYNVNVGFDVSHEKLLAEFDAVVLAGGAEKPRDLPIPGRELAGIHFAMDFLPQQNRRVGKEPVNTNEPILAAGKNVVVIGGGDTGSDCIGTSVRQGALKVTQLEIMPKPPEKENKLLTWPEWPLKLRTSSSHEEGAERDFAVNTVEFKGDNGHVKKLRVTRVDAKFQPIPGSEFDIKADLVLLAMGFVSPMHEGLIHSLGLKLDPRNNVAADTLSYKSSAEKVFACGDMRRGQSLVVWAIREGRQCAHSVDKHLMGATTLPR